MLRSAGPALGRTGARYLVSLIVGVVTIGWFGVQTAVCGASLALMLADVFGLAVPVWACSTALGALMLATALVGFDGLKWVSSVAAPLLVAICLYGVGASVAQTGSLDALLGYVPLPADAIGLIAGVNMAVGLSRSRAPRPATSPASRARARTPCFRASSASSPQRLWRCWPARRWPS
mgnify:CR=1 FL=1